MSVLEVSSQLAQWAKYGGEENVGQLAGIHSAKSNGANLHGAHFQVPVTEGLLSPSLL